MLKVVAARSAVGTIVHVPLSRRMASVLESLPATRCPTAMHSRAVGHETPFRLSRKVPGTSGTGSTVHALPSQRSARGTKTPGAVS